MVASNYSDVISRLVDAERSELAPAVAQALLGWRFAPQDLARMEDLSERRNQGTLAPEELDELQFYDNLGTLVDILQARARLALRRQVGRP